MTGFTRAIFRPNPEVRAVVGGGGRHVGHQVGTKLELSGDQVAVLVECREPRAMMALLALVGRSNRTKFRRDLLAPLIRAGLLEPTIPDKPTSSRQRYRLTPAGRSYLAEIDG